ncbi:phosphoserine phosphatase SerB [Alteromonas ponticola]|uniref:Phosphoserine phosphatase n=1 Tax=Alteromonas aquimaris TaxID=2998417 RepID=A0ABT3P3Q8_9ALTE|nr:phosphoserine phosphatase SerB [Alteromonas aquimaris]MCW8107395.1 phosphoserine phosphatase SerB [Alteromonas aquimaris]
MSLNQHSYASLLTLKHTFNKGWTFGNSSTDIQSLSHQEGESETLTIIGQALTLNVLFSVQDTLSAVLDIKSFQFHPLSERFGDCVVVAKVVLHKSEKLSELLADVAKAHHIEIALQRQQPKLGEPGLLVMDMDSTVIQIECIDEIAKLAGVGEKVSAVTELAMRGELDFKQSLVARVACLEGVEECKLESIRNAIPLMPGLSSLVHVLKANQWNIVIASGGFTYFAEHLRDRLGLDAVKANILGSERARLTGKVSGAIVDAESKAQAVFDYATQWNIKDTQTVAMGDGANDLLMMQAAALGVAFHAKPIVQQQADVAIRFGGLHTALYFLA